MTEIGRLKKSRSANKNVLKGYIVKAKDATREEYNEKNRLDIESILKAVEIKRKVVVDLDAKILELLEEENIEADIEEASLFELQLLSDVSPIENHLLENAKKASQAIKEEINTLRDQPASDRHFKASVKLPKIFIKKFYGDPITWQQFYETL